MHHRSEHADLAVDQAGGLSTALPRRLPGQRRREAAGLRSVAPARGSARATTRLSAAVVALDVAMIAAAMLVAWPLRSLIVTLDPVAVGGLAVAAASAPFLALLWVGVLALHGGYLPRAFGAGAEEFQNLAKGTVIAALGAATLCYLSQSDLSRGFLTATFVVGGVFLTAERLMVRRWVRRARRHGHLMRRVLLVGTAPAIRGLADVLDRMPSLGFQVVGCTLTRPGLPVEVDLPARMIGSAHDVRSTCHKLGADTVMVAGGSEVELRDISWNLEGEGVDLIVVPPLSDVAAPRMVMRPAGGLPLLYVEEPQAARAGRWPKRVFDILGAGASLVLLTPVMAVVAALIKLEDRGPVLYRQSRIGLHGAPFTCWKFRSMAVDADQIDAALRAEHGYEVGLFKLADDPRVTRIGRVIRRYSLDELPQLFCVLRGSMSLVGPRPHLPVEVKTYSELARRRLAVRPGMTGLWQVSGRSNLSWEEAVRLDLFYRDNWSLVTDFAIIGKTVRAVLAKEGAY